MLGYVPGHNPRRRQAPEPRPDFVIRDGSRLAAILDAKYRDLWENPLPREMLYQLAIYALSREQGAAAAILYPTMAGDAREAVIEIRDPVRGAGRAYVVLRPVNLPGLAAVLSGGSVRQRMEWARWMAFGADFSAARVG
jgi:5-methylcytosine-specific restriction enzyme subunit McrC